MGSESISILMPWRGDDPWRLKLKDWVVKRWRALLPDAEILEGAGPLHGPFNRSAAINEAFRKSSGKILVIADADTATNVEALRQAIYLTAIAGIALPYAAYFNLREPETEAILAEKPDALLSMPGSWEHRLMDSVSGIFAIMRDGFEAAGGFDEHFVEWGAEDRAFELAVSTLWRNTGRVSAHVIHLWHPAPESARFRNPHMQANEARYNLYLKAKGDEQAMRKLIEP
jgi:hypothetical protein